MQIRFPQSDSNAAKVAELEDFLDRSGIVMGAKVTLTVTGGDKVVAGEVVDIEAQDGRLYALTVFHDSKFSTVFASGLVAVTR